MRAVTLLGGVIGSGVLLLDVSATVTSAALGVVIAVIGLLFVGVVATGPLWLRAVVAAGSALLTASLWLAVETELGADRINPVVGVLGVVGFGLALLLTTVAAVRRRRTRAEPVAPAPAAEPTGPGVGHLPTPRAAVDDVVRVPAPRAASDSSAPGSARRTSHRSSRRQGKRSARGTHAR